jgi:hypothetical protein
LQRVLLEASNEFAHAEVHGELLEEDLDEDAGRGGGVFLVELDDREDVPFHGVGCEQEAEELSDDAEAVGFVAVDGLVVFDELALKELAPEAVELAEPRMNVSLDAIESDVAIHTSQQSGRRISQMFSPG